MQVTPSSSLMGPWPGDSQVVSVPLPDLKTGRQPLRISVPVLLATSADTSRFSSILSDREHCILQLTQRGVHPPCLEMPAAKTLSRKGPFWAWGSAVRLGKL